MYRERNAQLRSPPDTLADGLNPRAIAFLAVDELQPSGSRFSLPFGKPPSRSRSRTFAAGRQRQATRSHFEEILVERLLRVVHMQYSIGVWGKRLSGVQKLNLIDPNWLTKVMFIRGTHAKAWEPRRPSDADLEDRKSFLARRCREKEPGGGQ
jgi:hypothetical protein